LSEEELAVVEEGMIELATLLPKNPGEEKVQALLNADLNGETVEDSEGSDDEVETPAKAEKKPAAKVAAKETPTPAKAEKKPAAKGDDTDNEAMTDVDAMLAAIRARRKA
jgi:hypothetical protein